MQLCTLASGSGGNCAVISWGGAHILVDAGISARRISHGLNRLGISREALSGILITHEHGDHIAGLANFLKRRRLPVFASRETGRQIVSQVPIAEETLHTFSAGESFSLGGMEIASFPTSHDTPESVGYLISNGKVRIGVATDLGCVTREVAGAVSGAELLLLEANYDPEMLRSGPYPAYLKRRILSDRGHLSNEAAGDVAVAAASEGTRRIILGHLSQNNNTAGLAMAAVRSAIIRAGGALGQSVRLEVAPRQEPSPIYFVE